MKMFAVNNNTLTGTVPRSVGNWNQAGLVWLADNQFTGTLPDTIVKWSALLFFDVSQCCWFGINASLCAYTWQFQASRNKFTGSLPQSIGEWTALIDLNIQGCQSLTGSIPSSISRWQSIQYAFFNDTALVGTIPEDLCSIMNLTDLVADCLSEVVCTCCTACYWCLCLWSLLSIWRYSIFFITFFLVFLETRRLPTIHDNSARTWWIKTNVICKNICSSTFERQDAIIFAQFIALEPVKCSPVTTSLSSNTSTSAFISFFPFLVVIRHDGASSASSLEKHKT